MKLTKKKLIFTIFVFILLIVQIRHSITNIQTSQLYYIISDSRISPDLTDQIKDYINKDLKSATKDTFVKAIKERFPIVSSIVFQRKNPDLIAIKLNACSPLYKVNEKLIFCSDDMLIDKTQFSTQNTEHLDNIQIENEITPNVITFLRNIPEYVISNFNVDIKNKNYVLLTDKDDEKFILITTLNKVPTNKIIESTKDIKENKNENREFIADLRFNDQIVILDKLKGG